VWTVWGGLPIRTCTQVQSEPSGRSSIVGAHHRISRRRSVSCYQSAGEGIKAFFLALDASERLKVGEQGLLGW